MTFDQAIEAAKQGKSVRHKDMSPKWTMVWRGNCHYFINPVTGSATSFALTDTDRAADWVEVK